MSKKRKLSKAPLLALVMLASLASAIPAQADPPGTGWVQVLNENFTTKDPRTSSGVNPDLWYGCPKDACSPPPNRLARYAPDQPFVKSVVPQVAGQPESGHLFLGIGKCPGFTECGQVPYISGMLRSRYAYKYGYFEMGAFAFNPLKWGEHPVFWLFDEVGTWGSQNRPQFEIDIAEFAGNQPPNLYQALWWDNYAGSRVRTHTQGGLHWAQGYHVYAINWTPTAIGFYVDGVAVRTFTQGQTGNDSGGPLVIPNVPLNIRMTMQVGPTSFTGDPDINLARDARFRVDYIRVWQQNCSGCDCAVFEVPGGQ